MFEIGRCFRRDPTGRAGRRLPSAVETRRLWPAAARCRSNGASAARKVDFFDVKGDLEALLAPRQLRFEKVDPSGPASRPRCPRAARWTGTSACIGELHPQWVQKYDLPTARRWSSNSISTRCKAANVPAYAEVSRFPPVIRDLAIVVDHELALQTLLDGLNAKSPAIVQDIQLFDVYTGKGVAGRQEKSCVPDSYARYSTDFARRGSRCGDAATGRPVLQQAFAAQLRA